MNLAKTIIADNPNQAQELSQRITAEQATENLILLVEEIKATVQNAAQQGSSFDQTERDVWDAVLQTGFQAMQLFVSLQGDGDLGERVQTEQGKTLHRCPKPASTTIRSIFGTHPFDQYTYAAGSNKPIELRPISARMSLPQHRWSFMLQEFSQMFCVDQAFNQATANLSQLLGGRFSVDTTEKLNQRLGKAAGEYLDDLPSPDADSEAKFLVGSADCKGVPLVKEDTTKIAAFETAKKNPGNRRMATVASVYTVDPHIRTAEEITEALFREPSNRETGSEKQRPKPQNKNTTAHFPTSEDDGVGNAIPISGIHVAMAWIIGQVTQRRRPGQVLIALMDGQESLWDTFGLHVSLSKRTIAVLDILHALAYVWEAAGLFCNDEAERKCFTRSRLLRLLRGEVLGVVRGLRQMGSTRQLKGKPLQSLYRICGYLENNASRMRYDEYLRRGYPIASGVIEGACRHLVKDRMERSGMRWTLEGARSMLHVRAAFQSDHWQSFLRDRMNRELAATHRHQELISNYTSLTLAS